MDICADFDSSNVLDTKLRLMLLRVTLLMPYCTSKVLIEIFMVGCHEGLTAEIHCEDHVWLASSDFCTSLTGVKRGSKTIFPGEWHEPRNKPPCIGADSRSSSRELKTQHIRANIGFSHRSSTLIAISLLELLWRFMTGSFARHMSRGVGKMLASAGESISSSREKSDD